MPIHVRAPGEIATDLGPAERKRGRLTLSPRQLQVLRLMAEGFPDKGIASELGISERAVRFHIALCRNLLGTPSRTALVAAAFRRNLLR